MDAYHDAVLGWVGATASSTVATRRNEPHAGPAPPRPAPRRAVEDRLRLSGTRSTPIFSGHALQTRWTYITEEEARVAPRDAARDTPTLVRERQAARRFAVVPAAAQRSESARCTRCHAAASGGPASARVDGVVDDDAAVVRPDRAAAPYTLESRRHRRRAEGARARSRTGRSFGLRVAERVRSRGRPPRGSGGRGRR